MILTLDLKTKMTMLQSLSTSKTFPQAIPNQKT